VWASGLPPSRGAAEERPQMTLGYHFLKDSQLEEAIPGVTGSGDAEFTVSTVDFEAAIPFLLARSQLEGIDAVARMFKADFLIESRNVEEIIFTQQDEDLVSLGARLAYVRRLSSRWSLTGFAGAKLAVEDLAAAQFEDLTYQGGLRFDRRPRENFAWGIGAMYTQITGSDLVLPLLHLDWRGAADRLRVGLSAPPELLAWRASLRYAPSPGWSVGVASELVGDEYQVNSVTKPLLDASGNVVSEGVRVSLAYAEVIVGPELVLRPGPTFELGFLAGVSTARRFEFIAPEEGGTLRFNVPGYPEADFELESVFTLKLNAVYTFQ
jgi:hypothetical protein